MKYAVILFGLLIASPLAAQEQDAASKESKLFRVMGWATYGTSAADLATTEYGLAHGAVELNPLQQHCLSRCATHALIPPLVNFTTAKIYHSGHERTALWVRIGVNVFYGAVVVRNLRQF